MTRSRSGRTKAVGISALALLAVAAGLGEAAAAGPDPEAVITAWERFVDDATATPGDCTALRAKAAAFLSDQEKTLGALAESDVAISEDHLTRLQSSQERLVPMLLLCGGSGLGAQQAEGRTAGSEDRCKEAEKECPKICPVGKWTCVIHTGACAGGDHRSCCWTAMCLNSKKGCILTCKNSCICDVPQ